MERWLTLRKSRLAVCLATLFVYFGSVNYGQPQSKIPRVAYFAPRIVLGKPDSASIEAFRLGLKDLGLKEGTNFLFDFYSGEGKLENFPKIAKTIVALKPDVIVTAGTPTTRALMLETKTIPIVMAMTGDPVGSGLVASLARPGGNVTGLSMRSPEVSGKRLELIKEIRPKARRVAIFWVPTNDSHPPTLTDTRAAARALNIDLQAIDVRKASDLPSALTRALAMKVDAFTVIRDSQILLNRELLISFANNNKLPAVYDGREFPLEGGLMSYTPSALDLHRRSAIYVDKILKGANPATLPVEQTMRAEFILNLKAARRIGVTIPPEMLVLADQVIE